MPRPSDAATSPSIDAPQSREALLASLHQDKDEATRRAAAGELAGMHATEELIVALQRDDSDAVRQAILTGLITIGDEQAAAGLAACLRSEDVALRNGAIEALQQMGQAAGAHVESLLASDDADVRLFAINVLEALRHQNTRIWLHQVLARDTEVNVGLGAVEALAQFGGPEDVAALRDFAQRFPNEPFVEFAVNMASRRLAAGEPR
jgi:HEAT repeat protein